MSSSFGSSKSIGLPCEIISGNGPSAGLESKLRLKKILNGAKNRCQATPIVKSLEITINQSADTQIFIPATV
ncbi:unannotated protein [freshwater metagenome]|uniref:Unannotated protein n=1 Tax=freshwater metagenome TaxID=449393 RepID=A0A6J6UXX3_9ZZZZ